MTAMAATLDVVDIGSLDCGHWPEVCIVFLGGDEIKAHNG